MGTENNKRIAQDFLKYMVSDQKMVLDLLSEDFTWTVMGGYPAICPLVSVKNKEEVAETLKGFGTIMPKGMDFIIKSVTAEGDRVSVEAESKAELANGKTYNNSYHMMFECSDSKIKALREYCDTYYANIVFTE